MPETSQKLASFSLSKAAIKLSIFRLFFLTISKSSCWGFFQTERHFIMQVVCEATQATDIQVKVAALQCLVKIMSLYYQYMESYMGPALFAITLEAMKSEAEEVKQVFQHILLFLKRFRINLTKFCVENT